MTDEDILKAEEELETYNMTLQEERDYYCKCMRELQDRIKEVREIFKYYGVKEDIVGYSNYTITGEDLIKLLEILDKGESND